MKLICLMGPSGSGKDTILSRLHGIRRVPRLTTRGIKPGETEGVHYRSISKEDYEKLDVRGTFVYRQEHAKHLYGIEKSRVQEELSKIVPGEVPLMVTCANEWLAMRQQFPKKLVTIRLQIPSLKEAERRLKGRGDDSPETIRLRLESIEKSEKVLADLPEDIRREINFVVNDDLDTAVEAVQQIIDSQA